MEPFKGAVIREPVPGWVPTQSRTEKEQREKAERVDRNGLDGPPLYLCHGCGKIEEGSWSGRRAYPKKNRHIYVAQAIKMTPGGWRATIIAPSCILALCSKECESKYPMEASFK